MNRRNFLLNLAKGIAAFTILPPATTYERIWKVERNSSIITVTWIKEMYEEICKFEIKPNESMNKKEFSFYREYKVNSKGIFVST